MRAPRQAARIAVLDPDGAIFLQLHDDAEIGLHWMMPGGGLEAGEDELTGALREAAEETGWTDLQVGPPLWRWEHDYTRMGVPTRQSEVIFQGAGPRREPIGDLAASYALDGILTCRWWTPAELAASTDLFWPPQLPDLLATLRADGPPAKPVDLGYVPNEPRTD
ncbi:MAG TPA: NUDIX domain-containing protein [Actinocrinis sp.]|nr:NUDIX domain-containing protein [Actinocrinis sp.]